MLSQKMSIVGEEMCKVGATKVTEVKRTCFWHGDLENFNICVYSLVYI